MIKVISRMSSLILKKSDDMILFAHDHPVKLGETLMFGNSLGIVMSIFVGSQLALLLQQSEVLEPIQHVNSLQAYHKNDICTIAEIGNQMKTQLIINNYQKESFRRFKFQQIMCILISFIQLHKEILNKLKSFDQIIYYGRSPIQQAIWFKQADNQGSNYFQPKYAFKQKAKTNKTLLIMDQIYDHFVAHKKLQKTLQFYVYEKTTKTSFPNLLVIDQDMAILLWLFYIEIPKMIYQKKSEYLQKQQLKIYQYFDCKPIVQMINLFNQQNSQVQLVILLDFSVMVVNEESICQLKGSPKEILNDLLGVSCQIKKFDRKTFAEFYYEKTNELDGNEFQNVIIESLG